MLRGRLRTLNVYITKEEIFQSSKFPSEDIEKEKPNKPKASKRKEIIKVRTEINKIENRIKTIKQRIGSWKRLIK